MKKLLRNKKGFTLMEMLIVVAIIVILVAISVPTFTANLNDAKKAADAANLRAAKSAGAMYALTAEDGDVYYDADLGDISTEEPEGYGQCTTHKDAYIKVTISDGKATCTWANSEGELEDCD